MSLREQKYLSADFEDDRVVSADQRPEWRLNSQESDRLSGLKDCRSSGLRTPDKSSNLQAKVEHLEYALQDAGKISVLWRRLSIFLLILLVCIVAATIISLVVVASKKFETVQKLYIQQNETLEDNTEMMTKFVQNILNKKEVEFRAERDQAKREIARLRDEFAGNQSRLETRMRVEKEDRKTWIEGTFASKADLQALKDDLLKSMEATSKATSTTKEN